MQVLHCSRLNVQRMHRAFAVNICSSTWERCSRDNLFRRVQSGSLGLAHLLVRQLVNRLFFLRDSSDPFLRRVCQVRWSQALPEFVVSMHTQGNIFGY